MTSLRTDLESTRQTSILRRLDQLATATVLAYLTVVVAREIALPDDRPGWLALIEVIGLLALILSLFIRRLPIALSHFKPASRANANAIHAAGDNKPSKPWRLCSALAVTTALMALTSLVEVWQHAAAALWQAPFYALMCSLLASSVWACRSQAQCPRWLANVGPWLVLAMFVSGLSAILWFSAQHTSGPLYGPVALPFIGSFHAGLIMASVGLIFVGLQQGHALATIRQHLSYAVLASGAITTSVLAVLQTPLHLQLADGYGDRTLMIGSIVVGVSFLPLFFASQRHHLPTVLIGLSLLWGFFMSPDHANFALTYLAFMGVNLGLLMPARWRWLALWLFAATLLQVAVQADADFPTLVLHGLSAALLFLLLLWINTHLEKLANRPAEPISDSSDTKMPAPPAISESSDKQLRSSYRLGFGVAITCLLIGGGFIYLMHQQNLDELRAHNTLHSQSGLAPVEDSLAVSLTSQLHTLLIFSGLIGALFSLISRVRMDQSTLRRHQSDYARLLEILEHSKLAVTLFDAEGNVIWFNPQATRVYNISPVLLQQLNPLTHEFWQAQGWHDLAQATLSDGVERSIEYAGKGSHGQSMDFQASLQRVSLADQFHLLVQSFDLTEIHKTQRALKASEQRYQHLFSANPTASFIAVDGLISDCNQSAETMLGAPRDKIIGRSPIAFSPTHQPGGQLSEDLAAMHLRDLQRDGQVHFEFQHKRLDGSLFMAEVNATAIELNDEAAILFSWHDVSLRLSLQQALIDNNTQLEHKIAERTQQLSDAKQFSDQILDTLESAFILLDREGRIQRFNQAAQRSTGFSWKQLHGQAIWEFLIPPEQVDNVRAVFQQLLLGSEGSHYENEWLTASGERLLFAWRNSYIRDADGAVTHVIAIGEDITERRRIEVELDQHRFHLEQLVEQRTAKILDTTRRLELATETAGLGLWHMDLDTEIIEIDRQMRLIYGLDLAEEKTTIRYADWLNYVHPDDVPAFENEWRDVLKRNHQGRYSIEFRIQHPTSGIRHIETTLALVRNSEWKPTHLIGVDRDVSDRKHKEIQLGKAAAIIHSSDDAILSKSLNGRILSWNPGAQKLLGFDEDDVLGQSVSVVVPEHLLDEERRLLDTIALGKTVRHYETLRRHKQGHLVEVSLTLSPILNEHNDIIGASSIARDITHQKQLERINQQLRAILDRSHDFFGLAAIRSNHVGPLTPADIERNISFINAQGMELIGRPHSDVQNFPSLDTLYPAWALQIIVEQALPSVEREHYWSGEIAVLHADGHEIPVMQEIILGREGDGTPSYIGTIMRSLEETKRNEHMLIDARRRAEMASIAKSDFLSTMSHEIRTPLHGILGSIELLTRTQLQADQRNLIDKAQKTSQVLLNLINDILDFSQIEEGKLVIQHQLFDLRHVLDKVMDTFSGAATQRRLYLNLEVAEDCPTLLLGDPTRITQVIMNLVSNAIKFTDRGGVNIVISSHATPTASDQHREIRLRCLVRDTGRGISQLQQEVIFERFTQVDSGNTRSHGGSGLGLAIVERLVHAMHGEIGVESEVGLGSLFWFILPMPVANPQQVAAVQQRLAKPVAISAEAIVEENLESLDKLHILVAEDQLVNQDIMLETLTRLGAKPTLACDGQEAVNQVLKSVSNQTTQAKPPFDLVLMDVQMPNMDGIEATTLIRKVYDPQQLPIIATSAGVQAAQRERCLDAGMNDFLSKPISIHDLQQQILRYCRGKAPVDLVSPTQSASPSLKTALPDIEGFDLAAACERLGNDPAVYLRLCQRFLGTSDDLRSELLKVLADASDAANQDAARQLHALRGSLMTLGANAMWELTKSIEDSLHDTPQAQRAQISSAFDQAFTRTIDTLKNIVAQGPTSPENAD